MNKIHQKVWTTQNKMPLGMQRYKNCQSFSNKTKEISELFSNGVKLLWRSIFKMHCIVLLRNTVFRCGIKSAFQHCMPWIYSVIPKKLWSSKNNHRVTSPILCGGRFCSCLTREVRPPCVFYWAFRTVCWPTLPLSSLMTKNKRVKLCIMVIWGS